MSIELEQLRNEILMWLTVQESAARTPQKTLFKRRWAQAQEDALKRVKDYVAAIAINSRDVEWSCGHIAGSMCAECYRELANRTRELAEENMRLREQLLVQSSP